MKIIGPFDNPVGNWWQCDSCDNDIFIPIYDAKGKRIKQIKYCSYCGEIITSFNKIAICIENSAFGFVPLCF